VRWPQSSASRAIWPGRTRCCEPVLLAAARVVRRNARRSEYSQRMVDTARDIVVIHTDGGCRPNPGPGGWGAVLRQRQHVREMYGGESTPTSNNRMELTAPIMALEALTRAVHVHLHTDSTYVRNGITKWVLGWERNGWMTAAKQPVKNVDLWRRLQAACARHRVEWFWVKGHAGVADNELADQLATRGLQEAIGWQRSP
jgi:ribonuclease HI